MKIFENTSGIDFPFYNGIPELSKLDWIIFLLGPVLTILTIFGILDIIPGINIITDKLGPVWFCLLTLLPVTYVCRGKLQIFFKMPKRSDIKIIIACYILNTIFTLVVGLILIELGITLSDNTATIAHALFTTNNGLVLIQIIGEELCKVSILLCAMALIYHFTENRKLSVILATLITMFIFGLMHLGSYNWNFIQSLILIGLGSIFDIFPYLKTKNLTNSYIVHVLIDIIPTML